MGSLRQDIGYSLRMFLRNPGFAAITVLILAVGVGANTAIFSLLNALVLRELPVPQPEQLVELSSVYRNGSKIPFSFPMFKELDRGQRSFSDLLGWTGITASSMEWNGVLSLSQVRAVTGNYHSALGAKPLLGRLITPEDLDGTSDSHVAVLGHDFWDRHFGRDPSMIGGTIRINGQLFTIVGVTRKWFMGITPGQLPEITIPITAASFDHESRSALWVFVAGRLNHGTTIEQARAQLHSFWPDLLAATVPTDSPGERRQSFLSMQLEVESAATGINAGLRSQFAQPLYLLMGIGGLILLVVCVNFANLTLARVAARRCEMSTRVALGADPRRIIGQLLTESVLLSFSGAALALVFAYWGSQLLIGLMTEGTLIPVLLDVRPDWRVFSFTAVAALLTGLLIGLVPAWQMSRQEPASVLRQSERSLGRRMGKLGRTLIITQIALSLVLLQGAGLFRGTLEALRSSDPGFQRGGVLEVTLYAKPGGYGGLDTHGYRRQLTERIADVPGVLSVALSQLPMPIGERGWKDAVSRIGTDSDTSVNLVATLVAVSPGFFETLGVPLVSGRDFDWMDDDQHPRVAIIPDNVARRLMPSGNEIGERIRFGVQPEFQDLEVVAVARSARLVDLRNADIPVVYVPLSQHPFSQRGNLLVRANDPTTVTRVVETEVRSLGHEYSTSMKTLEQTSEQALLHERAIAMLSSVFAVVALLLVGLGLFGLMSYTVTRRTGEIGIRMALGSQRSSILRIILGETLVLTMAGVAVGLPCAIAAARLFAHMLFGLSPADPATLLTVVSMLLAVGVIAGYFPAQRAMKMDPLVALRHE